MSSRYPQLMHGDLLTAYTWFLDLRQVHGDERIVLWDEFVDYLKRCATSEIDRGEHQALYSPALFDPPRRNKKNVVGATMLVVDVDHAVRFDDVVDRFRSAAFECVVHTTKRSVPGDERVRVIVPLLEPIEAATYTLGVHSVARFAGVDPDATKVFAENLLWLPARLEGKSNRLEHISGQVMTAEDWLARFPIDQLQPLTSSSPVPRDGLEEIASAGPLLDSSFVAKEWIDSYRSLGPGQHHKGLFAFMSRVAMRAISTGHRISPAELASLARELDALEGSGHVARHPDLNLEADAGKAITWAQAHANVPPEASWAMEEGESVVPTVAHVPGLPVPRAPDPALVQPFDISAMAYATGARGINKRPDFLYLAQHCVELGRQFAVKSGQGRWTVYPKQATAMIALYQEHARLEGEMKIITKKTIEKFFKPPTGGLLHFKGACTLPGAPEFVMVRGARLLNTWRDGRMDPAGGEVAQAETIVRMIREALCDLDPVPFETLVHDLTSASPQRDNIFRWVMEWLAACYQQPGRHIGVMLWLVGQCKGIGKGTLVQVMQRLLGPEVCGKASAEAIESGWNDFILGRVLVEADEFQMSSSRDLNRVFKGWIGNPLLTINQKYQDAYEILNVTNWIGTTNRVVPLELEAGDRRHTFVKTTDDESRKKFAERHWEDRTAAGDAARLSACRGFAALLARIDVDQSFVGKPFVTETKVLATDLSASPAERFLDSIDHEWEVGETRPAAELYAQYRAWLDANDPDSRSRSQKAFGTRMVEIPSVRRELHPVKRTVTYTKVRHRANRAPARWVEGDDNRVVPIENEQDRKSRLLARRNNQGR